MSDRLADAPPMGVVARSLVLPAIVYAPLGLWHLPAASPPLQVLLAIGFLGVVCTALAFLLFFALIAEVGPVRATVITYVNPAVALALGVALLGEPLTIGAGVGFALILAGLVLATSRAQGAAATASKADEPLVEARWLPRLEVSLFAPKLSLDHPRLVGV